MISGSCHCGAVRFELAAPPEEVTDCNCSICRRLGVLWAYYRPDQVTMIREPGATLAYVWSDKLLEFHTCRTCGCTTSWEPVDKARDRMAINARLIDPPLSGVPVMHFDGADTWKPVGRSVFPPEPFRSDE